MKKIMKIAVQVLAVFAVVCMMGASHTAFAANEDNTATNVIAEADSDSESPIGDKAMAAADYNIIGAVVPGKLKITTPEGLEIVAAVSEGLVKVENNHVFILVDTAEHPEEIDENRARHAMEEAKEALLQKKSIQDYHAAQTRMARAINRLKVKGGY